ncbi:MAG TPA: LamG-like jellyroll fold domain-containing protein, partial [Kiritimatiellia bacterium]
MSYAALSLVGLAGNALAQTNALLLDGSNDVVHVAHNASLNTLPLTVTAWFRTTRDTPEPHGVLSKYSFASIDGYSMTMANGQLTAIYGNGSGYLFNGGLLNSGPVADGFWHHVAMVVTTNGGAMYLDGDLVDSNGWTGASGATTTTAPLLFGNFATFTNACF